MPLPATQLHSVPVGADSAPPQRAGASSDDADPDGTPDGPMDDYAAALAARFGDEEPDDLVAILPHADLQHFRKTGEAIRVYLGSGIVGAPGEAGRCLSLSALAVFPETETADFGPCWFAFAVIAPRLKSLSDRPIRPLGPVLFQARQSVQFARTAWLLARDLRTSSLGEGLDRDTITDLALRAVAIDELRPSPTGRQGSARSAETARSAALATLRDRAEAADSNGLAGYWRGLRAWYSGTDPYDPSSDPALMRGELRDYLDHAASGSDDPRRHAAETLIAIAGLVWGGEPDGLAPLLGHVDHGLTAEGYFESLADDGRPLEIPSPLLLRHLADLVPLRRAVEQMTGAADRRPDESDIDALLGQLVESEGAVSRLPVHEVGLMHYLHLKAVERLRALRAALRLDAQIEVEVLNPHLDAGLDSALRVEVRNRGAGTARRFKIDLSTRDGADESPRRDARFLDDFGPGTLSPPIAFQVRAAGPALVVSARWSFVDGSGEAVSDTRDFPLEVRTHNPPPWTTITSHYAVGNAVFGHGRFFGRDAELRKLFSVLTAPPGQAILLRGPRRMGKTSLLKQIDWLLQNPGELTAYPLSAVQIQVLARIVPVSFNLQDLADYKGAAAYRQFFRRLMVDVHLALAVPLPSAPAADESDPGRSFSQALGGLLDRSGRRVLIMLDEWDETARPELDILNRNLRALMIGEQRVNWMVCSTFIRRDENRRSSSPLHNMCLIHEIGEFDWPTARTVILEPAAQSSLHWHGDAVIAAVEQTGQWPFLLQVLGAGVVDELNQRKASPLVTVETVGTVLGRMAQGELPTATNHFESIFARPDETEDKRDAVRTVGWLILWALNEERFRPDPRGLTLQDLSARVAQQAPERVRNRADWSGWFSLEFSDQMDLLQDAQYVIAPDPQGCYRIRVPVFGAWFDTTQKGNYGLMIEALAADLDRPVSRGLG
jgi:hypothetical protein